MSIETEDKCPCVYFRSVLLIKAEKLGKSSLEEEVSEVDRIKRLMCDECQRASSVNHAIELKIAQAIGYNQ